VTKSFCDRCYAETTGVRSCHVMGIDDADEDGQGDIAKDADLCVDCYAAFLEWLKERPAADAVGLSSDEPSSPAREDKPSSS
jgi:hypothetical protein